MQIKYIERSKTNISVEEIFKKGTVRCCGYKGTKRFNEKTPSNDCSLCLSQRNWFKNEWCFYHNDKSLSHCYNFWGKSSHPNFCGGQKITKCNSCMSKTSCKACIGGVSISAIWIYELIHLSLTLFTYCLVLRVRLRLKRNANGVRKPKHVNQ